ncbi:MAG: hypothetical protein ACRDT4_18800 [Micromonosporaceae bacterium]
MSSQDWPLVRLRHVARLTPPQPGDVLVNTAPGPDGAMLALWASPAAKAALTERITAPNGVRYSPSVLRRPVDVRVAAHRPGSGGSGVGWAVEIPELRIPASHVQVLPGERVLLAGSRCDWRARGPDQNAAIYDADGAPAHSGTLGDGINSLLTTAEGRIWAGYFDEGIFGNRGWGRTGPAPIGAPGLVCFDQQFQPVWGLKDGAMADCYALTLAGEDAWACYYSNFPVVRARPDAVRSWHNGEAGYALMVHTPTSRVGLFSGYGQQNLNRLLVGRLGADAVEWEPPRWVVLPDGTELPSSNVRCHGSSLYIITDTADWYALDLADLTT